MALWLRQPTVEQINAACRQTMVAHLGIEFTGVGEDWLSARMPADERTKQPYGILHGGASAALAETLGSFASSLVVDTEKLAVVGIEINANHIRPVREGWVSGTCRPVHVGRTLHVWDIRIVDEDDRLTCVARLTVAVRRLETR